MPRLDALPEWDDFNLRNFIRECWPRTEQAAYDREWAAAQAEWSRRHGVRLDPKRPVPDAGMDFALIAAVARGGLT